MLKENLKMLRAIKGVSQEAVAEAVGVSRQAYAKWESGESVPDIEKAMLIAKYYDVNLDELMLKREEVSGRKLSPAPRGKHIWGVVTLSERGQIVIPAEARELFSLKSGSRLVVLGDENEGIALVPAEVFEKRLDFIRGHLGAFGGEQ